MTTTEPCRAVWLADGSGHVLLGTAARGLQLSIHPSFSAAPAQVLATLPSDPAASAAFLNALACFARLRISGQVEPRFCPPEPRGRRLSAVLYTLDASLGGATHREIAALLVGDTRAAAAWRDPGQHLRDRVRRAVRRGHALMNGEYKSLLR